jgi:putative oxidoreductase
MATNIHLVNIIAMKITGKNILDIVQFLLILLWVYAASSKLLNYPHFKIQMHIQTLPARLSDALVYTVPSLELLAAIFLLFSKTKLAGLYLSLILMILFTGYVGLVILNFFGRTPCSCGGVLKQLGWNLHFFFNLFYLLLTITGICILQGREGKPTIN